MKRLLVFMFLLAFLGGCSSISKPKEDEYVTSSPNFKPEGRFLIRASSDPLYVRERASVIVKRRCDSGVWGWQWKSFPIQDEEGKKYWIIEYSCKGLSTSLSP